MVFKDANIIRTVNASSDIVSGSGRGRWGAHMTLLDAYYSVWCLLLSPVQNLTLESLVFTKRSYIIKPIWYLRNVDLLKHVWPSSGHQALKTLSSLYLAPKQCTELHCIAIHTPESSLHSLVSWCTRNLVKNRNIDLTKVKNIISFLWCLNKLIPESTTNQKFTKHKTINKTWSQLKN